MRAKKGESAAAVELEKELSPMKKVVLLTSFSMAGMAIICFLDVRSAYFLARLVHCFGVFNLDATLKQEKVKTCAGLSLKSLQLTALHLAVRFSYSLLFEPDHVHGADIFSFLTTLYAIYLVHTKFQSSYVDNQDNFNSLYLVIPCALLSLAIHPAAFCRYIQSVSLLPQLLLMQKRKIVEPFTAEYVFMLGAHRLLFLEIWVIEIFLTQGQSQAFLGYNMWSAFMAVLSDIVNGLILVDFCYYYLTMDFDEDLGMLLPSDLV